MGVSFFCYYEGLKRFPYGQEETAYKSTTELRIVQHASFR